MKRVSTLCALLFAVATALGQIQMDTLQRLPVGPGCIHMKLVAPAVPWTINVLEVDLDNPYITMESVKALDRMTGFERTSSMAARNSFAGHTVIGATNGDYYSSTPTNMQIRNGEMLLKSIHRSVVAFTAQKDPWIGIVSLSSFVKTASQQRTINGVNQARGADQLILYSKYFGANTGTNIFGAEAVVNPLSGWYVNDTMRCVVESLTDGVGSTAIPAGKAVLSGHGTAQSFMVTNLHVGDTIRVFMGALSALARTTQMVGGGPKIIHNGLNYVDQGYQEEGQISHTYEVHPRTAAGYNASGSKLFLVTVDGRQTTSAGMTLHQLANFMITLGVDRAVNLDGGGSTTMVVQGAIANSPSDGGGERTVSNSLIVVSSAPQDTLSRIYMNPKRYRIYRGESITFTLYGTDQYGNPIPLNPALKQFSVLQRLGTIDSAGRFIAALTPDSGYVYARYGSVRDSAFVVVKSIGRVTVSPQNVVTDTVRKVTFRARAYDWDGVEKGVAQNEYQWSVSNPAVGAVDTVGAFKAKLAGATQVRTSYLGVSDTADVTVQVVTGFSLLDSMESTARWTATGTNATASVAVQNGVATFGSKSLKLNYSFVYDPSVQNFARLETDIPIAGVPDSLLLDVRADSSSHRVIFYIDDDDGEQFRIYTSRYVNSFNGFDTMRVAFANAIPIGSAVFNYPVRLKKIEVQLGSTRVQGNTYAGAIYFDYPRLKYPSGVTSVKREDAQPGSFELYQNYPNPFNPVTAIGFRIQVSGLTTLRIFDLLGREVTTLVNEKLSAGAYTVTWDAHLSNGQASSVASGVYFYRLTIGSMSMTRKLMVVR
ncbi:MAG: phosphodiester glycosidase family protein [Ignavibacteriae bacterium]|nr:phosphodiester glycosidase family protein [Ignavibacteriota bacterium]